MALTPKMQMFVEEYLVDLNATQAAIRAGYSPKTANRIAAENMSKPVIKAEIEKRMKERGEQVDINAKWVLERLVELTNRCMQAEPVLDREGNETGEYRFDSTGANKALDSIGKHLGMFKEKMELSGEGGGPMQVIFDAGMRKKDEA